jgi:predicted lipoprotein with Yx(FWY)xxD motif
MVVATDPSHPHRRRRTLGITLGTAGAAMLLAGCAAATNSLHPGRQVLSAAGNPELGPILVDEHGRTLYQFAADPPGRSTCYGACASIWPPATTEGPPRAGSGVAPGALATLTRRDGRAQLAYNDQPLYYYQADTAPGDASGQGLTQFGAGWYVVFTSGG